MLRSFPIANKLADANGFFFQPNGRNSEVGPTETAADGPSEKVQKMMDDLSSSTKPWRKASTEAEQSHSTIAGPN